MEDEVQLLILHDWTTTTGALGPVGNVADEFDDKGNVEGDDGVEDGAPFCHVSLGPLRSSRWGVQGKSWTQGPLLPPVARSVFTRSLLCYYRMHSKHCT